MDRSPKPAGEKLLADVPEESSSQLTAISLEIGTQQDQVQSRHSRRQARRVAHRKIRLAFTLGLHFLAFAANIAVMCSFAEATANKFLPILVGFWIVNAAVCTWVAWRDPDITFLASLGNARLPFLFLVYGVFQYIQVKHIVDVYKRRINSTQGVAVRTQFHAKTFDGIIGGIPFAWLCLWSYFLVDEQMQFCGWYLWQGLSSGYHSWFKWLYLGAGWASIVTLSMGIIEVDYRVSESVRDAIDSSVKLTFFQWSYRMTEAGSRICGIVLLCMVFEPETINIIGGRYGALIMPLYPLVWIIVYYLILATSRAQGAKSDQFLAHFVMAIIMWFTNPFRFVDSPSFIKSARYINTALWMARLAEFAVFVALLTFSVVNSFVFPDDCRDCDTSAVRDFPKDCGSIPGLANWTKLEHIGWKEDSAKPGFPLPVVVWRHIWDSQLELVVMWIAMVVLHGAVCTLRPFRVSALFRSEGILTDETVLDMIPAIGESDGAAVAVRPTVARGISSHVLRVGTGITSQLFAEEEQAFGNFVIEKVLGRGAYGVVVMVRMRNKKKSDGVLENADIVYAMKLQNTEVRRAKGTATGILPTREMTADREREIMRKLDHPFIIRLAYFFEVPDRALKDASSGDIIMDGNRNYRFHKAIVMEFCPGGDLDAFICKKAYPPGYKQLGRPMDDATAEWLQLTRRLAAEMCVALAFLHERDIVYRDLKPQNVLMKSGVDDNVHICYTDFGFSKDVSGTDSQAGKLDSLAGSPLYAAPEVMAIATRQARAEYTPAVDLFSLGRTICVMLWRVLLIKNPPELKMPSLEDCKNDARIHEFAVALMVQLTSPSPAQRGKASDLESKDFFQEITLENGQVLPALTWAGLEGNAS